MRRLRALSFLGVKKVDETEKKSELRDFALKVLYHLAEKENKSIADTCYELLKKSRAIQEPVPVVEPETKTEPRQATDKEIDSCLTLAEVAEQTRIYKQWLCNWATRHADRMKMKGKIRLWPADAVQTAKDEYYGVSSRQAASKTKSSGKTSAEAEAGMGEDKHTGGDDGEHRVTGGQTDKGNGEQMKQLKSSELFKLRCEIFRALLERGPVTCQELQHALKMTNSKTRMFVNSATYVIPFYEDEGFYKLMEKEKK